MTYEDILRDDEALFSKQRLSDALRLKAGLLNDKVEGLSKDRLLQLAIDDLVEEIARPLSYEPLVIDVAAVEGEPDEFQIPIARLADGSLRFGDGPRRGRGGNTTTPGVIVKYHVPFVGHPDLFVFGRDGWNSSMPRGVVAQGELVLTFICKEIGPHLDAAVQKEIDRIQQFIGEQRTPVDEHNKGVRARARQLLEQRLERVRKTDAASATMKFPLRRRQDAPRTYAAPEIRRKITPAMAPAARVATSPAGELEPTIPQAEYEHILTVMRSMSLVLERSPSAFEFLEEEDIRWHFVIQLNGQYEGSATGETFNAEGKTDILVRSGDRNIFIAECKFWTGPKGFNEAIEQLLGYLTWRDTKAALVIFNRNVEMTTVVTKVPEELKAHPLRDSEVKTISETEFRVVLHREDDHQRLITLTVMVFNVPKPQ